MKQYKMATISSPSIIKQPLRNLEIPLSKFSEEVIPHHQKILEQHKNYINKLISVGNVEQLSREIIDKKRVIKQLRDLLYELDTLRTQVDDSDLDSFDNRTMPLRTSILKLTKTYQDLEKAGNKLIHKNDSSPEESLNERVNPFEGASHLQIAESVHALKLKQKQERLDRVQEIQKDTEDLHAIYRDIHGMVQVQGDQVTQVEETTTNTEQNVNQGFMDVVKAHKINAVAYPATGAFVGSLLAGPIGLLAGLKVGSIAAVGCAFAGYASGKFIKKRMDEDQSNESEYVVNNENNENHTVVTNGGKKNM